MDQKNIPKKYYYYIFLIKKLFFIRSLMHLDKLYYLSHQEKLNK